MAWSVAFADAIVEEEFNEWPDDMAADFQEVANLIVELGLPAVGAPHVKKIRAKIWEIRVRGASGIGRALYVTVSGQRVVVVRCFIKKTRATPAREIEIAEKRAKELT